LVSTFYGMLSKRLDSIDRLFLTTLVPRRFVKSESMESRLVGGCPQAIGWALHIGWLARKMREIEHNRVNAMTGSVPEHLVSSPFGSSITPAEIVDTLSFFDNWEERYKYIIDLGKQLPVMDDALKTADHLIVGCQSQVWIESYSVDGKLYFDMASDAFIVSGLLAVVLAAYNGKTPAEVLAFDIEGFFQELDLIKHLSPTRGNGLKAMVARIRAVASAA
jgi:cysteine desulfuration protein SufE